MKEEGYKKDLIYPPGSVNLAACRELGIPVLL
jgi:hypothetical protein